MEPTHLLVIDAVFTLAKIIPPHVTPETVLAVYRNTWPREILDAPEVFYPYSPETFDCDSDTSSLEVRAEMNLLEMAPSWVGRFRG